MFGGCLGRGEGIGEGEREERTCSLNKNSLFHSITDHVRWENANNYLLLNVFIVLSVYRYTIREGGESGGVMSATGRVQDEIDRRG